MTLAKTHYDQLMDRVDQGDSSEDLFEFIMEWEADMINDENLILFTFRDESWIALDTLAWDDKKWKVHVRYGRVIKNLH